VPAVHVVRLHAGRIARVDQLAQPAEGDLR
jgi:hypothetical protein